MTSPEVEVSSKEEGLWMLGVGSVFSCDSVKTAYVSGGEGACFWLEFE